MIYLYPKQIIYLHKKIISETGGSHGVRDKGLLESALYRPQATFWGQDLYSDVFSKTAALGHAIVKNHPFLDGNKRVGFEAMRLMLRLNGFDIKASINKKFNFIVGIAEGKWSEQNITDWLQKHSVERK